MDYKIIEKKEILNEYAAYLVGSFDRIIIKRKIDDETDPLNIISSEISKIKSNIIGPGSKTLDDLYVIEIQLNVFRNLLQEIPEE